MNDVDRNRIFGLNAAVETLQRLYVRRMIRLLEERLAIERAYGGGHETEKALDAFRRLET